MTVQVFVDTVLLSWHDPREMAASFPAVMWYWLPFGLLQVTAGYTSTFVAQYTGADRPHRVGPAVWQGIHFAVVAGILVPRGRPARAVPHRHRRAHARSSQKLETIYLRCLASRRCRCWSWPRSTASSPAAGRPGRCSAIEAFGTAVNVALALRPDLRRGSASRSWASQGAGWATVAGSWASALLALVLLLRPKYRDEFDTLGGWRPERELFGRLMKYGGPAGMQVFLDVLVFHVFTQLVGRLGEAAIGATTLTVRLNMVAFLPMMGLGQAVCILVGQRLGREPAGPGRAERLHRPEVGVRLHVPGRVPCTC